MLCACAVHSAGPPTIRRLSAFNLHRSKIYLAFDWHGFVSYKRPYTRLWVKRFWQQILQKHIYIATFWLVSFLNIRHKSLCCLQETVSGDCKEKITGNELSQVRHFILAVHCRQSPICRLFNSWFESVTIVSNNWFSVVNKKKSKIRILLTKKNITAI